MASDGPTRLDPTAYLAAPDFELARCAAEHWWAEGYDADGAGTPLVLSWEAVREVLADRRLSPRCFSDDMVAAGISARTAGQVAPLFSLHGDEHRRHRALLSAAFTPRQVERVRPTAAAVAGRLADAIVDDGGRCEVVGAFAEPLPPEVFATLFGLPTEDRDLMAGWAADIAPAFTLALGEEEVARVERAAGELRAYAEGRIVACRAEPGDDLLSHLVSVEVDGEHLDDDQIVALVTGFVFAGAETTRRQLTAAVLLFSEHPGEWERLAASPALLPTAVDEVLRHRPIVPGLPRRAEAQFELGDLRIDEGERLLAIFGTANHDPARFDEPERFAIDRAEAGAHVTFGWGPHFCVGAGLARMELAEGLRALLERFGPPVVDEVGEASGLTAPDRLWVTFPLRAR